jgi:RNA polymerase-binding transcription factor DksA
MSALLSNDMFPGTPTEAAEHADARRRLQDERCFRLAQLEALEGEVPASPRHENVQRALIIAASAALHEVEAALTRLTEGRYGRCVTCHRPIDPERLAVLPMAALCMSCHFNEQNCRLPR